MYSNYIASRHEISKLMATVNKHTRKHHVITCYILYDVQSRKIILNYSHFVATNI